MRSSGPLVVSTFAIDPRPMRSRMWNLLSSRLWLNFFCSSSLTNISGYLLLDNMPSKSCNDSSRFTSCTPHYVLLVPAQWFQHKVQLQPWQTSCTATSRMFGKSCHTQSAAIQLAYCSFIPFCLWSKTWSAGQCLPVQTSRYLSGWDDGSEARNSKVEIYAALSPHLFACASCKAAV